MFLFVCVWKMWGRRPSSEITIIPLFGWDVSLCFGLTGRVAGYSQISTAVETKVHLLTDGSKFWYVPRMKKQVLTIWFLIIKFILFLFIIFCCWSPPGQKVFLSFVWFTYDGFWRQRNICNHSCTKEKKKHTEQHLVLTLTADPS